MLALLSPFYRWAGFHAQTAAPVVKKASRHPISLGFHRGGTVNAAKQYTIASAG